MIIAIDGPAGSGKTTVAKKLAQKLGFCYLDTGATYRALTYLALEKGLDAGCQSQLVDLAKGLELRFEGEKVYSGQKEITSQIRQPRIDKNISQIVAIPQVRQVMGKLQKSLAGKRNCVVEGRDMASVVFPGAEFKFYLDADPKVRAIRRVNQLAQQNLTVDRQEVEKDLLKRDHADMSRKHGCLKKIKEAIAIDTTGLSVAGVVEKLFFLVKSKIKTGPAL